MHNSTNDSTLKRRIAIRILLLIISFTIIIISYFYMGINIRNTHKRYINVAVNDSFNIIKTFINEMYTDTRLSTISISKDIEDKLNKAYPNLDTLKQEMDNDNYSNLSNIIKSVVSDKYYKIDNQRNTIFVATNKYILYDYNYMYTLDSDSKDKHNTWQTYISKDYNKNLSKNAFSKLYGYPDDMVFIEPYKSNIKDHKYYDEININILKTIYENEGIEGLKGYELLVPAYIKDTEDIFGKQEIVEGKRQDTYRLIVVQRINLYDQITQRLDNIYLSESYIEKLKNNTHNILTAVYSVGIIIIIGGSILLIHICALFNNHFILPIDKNEEATK